MNYHTTQQIETADAMATLRKWFPEGRADDLNVALFSTSGINGTYLSIEDAEACEEPTEVTFIVLRPRTVQTFWGNCLPQTAEDFSFLKQLRASSREILAKL